MRGEEDAFDAFRELIGFLLSETVIDPNGSVRLTSGPRRAYDPISLGGWNGPDDPLPLRDGRLLRLSMTLYREPHEAAHRLKVMSASYQYQLDLDGKDWIFRYDYARDPKNIYPAAHLQINGNLNVAGILSAERPLGRVHFPTDRFSIESVIRLLIVEFGVPSKNGNDYWSPLLRESEATFQSIAHRS